MAGIAVEWVRIVAEAGDGHATELGHLAHRICLLVAELSHIEMANAGIAAVGLARRPAHHFHADETELHFWWSPTPSMAFSADLVRDDAPHIEQDHDVFDQECDKEDDHDSN